MATSLVGRSLILALAASPQLTAEPDAPTPKERALMEYACPAALTPAAVNARERCLATRLLSLRADFGRDLGRLSTSARAQLDAACSPVQALRGREAYVGCLSGQLRSLSTVRVRPPVAAPIGAAIPDPAPTPAPTSVDTSMTASEQIASLVSMQTVVAGLSGVAGLAALVFFGVRAKRSRHVCRVCGVRVPGAGELCVACRHDAAEAVRRVAGERAGRERADEAEQRRQGEHTEELGQRKLRLEEEQRLRRLDEERRQEQEVRRRDEDARRQAEELQRAQIATTCDAEESIFDPYRALGLTARAGADDVRAAYDEARLKYDPAEVAHLGDDAQAHFAAKFRAVERAYQMLSGGGAQ